MLLLLGLLFLLIAKVGVFKRWTRIKHVVEILGKMLYLLWLSEGFLRVSYCLANWILAEDPNSAKSFKTPLNLPFLTTKALGY